MAIMHKNTLLIVSTILLEYFTELLQWVYFSHKYLTAVLKYGGIHYDWENTLILSPLSMNAIL
jgi:hypothetical protein